MVARMFLSSSAIRIVGIGGTGYVGSFWPDANQAAGGPFMGSRMVTVAPRPGDPLARIIPPCSLTMR